MRATMLTAEQRAQFDKAVKESDISKSLEEASVWLSAESPPIPGRTPPKPKAKKKAGAWRARRCRARAPCAGADGATALVAAGPKQHWGTAFDSVATPIYALGEGDPNYEADEVRRARRGAWAPAFQGVT